MGLQNLNHKGTKDTKRENSHDEPQEGTKKEDGIFDGTLCDDRNFFVTFRAFLWLYFIGVCFVLLTVRVFVC
jgi:hypothetical protein